MIGLYHVFMNKTGLIHVTLGNMADKYGPIFSFSTGGHRALVVSSWEMAKECFTGNIDILIFNAGGIDSYGLSQVPHGKYWKELRKICVHNLLSNQQLLKFRHLIYSEVDKCFNKLEGDDSTTTAAGMVRMDNWLAQLSFNVIGRIVCGFQSHTETNDFIDICLSIMEQPELSGNNYARQMPIKSIVVDMIGGANDTTKLTTIWTLSLLLNNPHVRSTNGEVTVDFDDTRNLVYIQAITKESMRLYPASPLVERLSSEDCVVGGFYVPAGTRLWVNIGRCNETQKFLSNAQKMVDVMGQNYELLPFGVSRQVCPGISFFLDLMQLILTRLILEFEIKSPSGKMDMTATQGLMSYKVVPLGILLTRRML
ncbi:hypothetical protein MKX01_012272 [Papaver californicum]|nr:hypothetical protein MKX01_012272 [Papaver californicum]